jgi:hypothetical protein
MKELPQEVIQIILLFHVHGYHDLVSFGLICRSWKSAADSSLLWFSVSLEYSPPRNYLELHHVKHYWKMTRRPGKVLYFAEEDLQVFASISQLRMFDLGFKVKDVEKLAQNPANCIKLRNWFLTTLVQHRKTWNWYGEWIPLIETSFSFIEPVIHTGMITMGLSHFSLQILSYKEKKNIFGDFPFLENNIHIFLSLLISFFLVKWSLQIPHFLCKHYITTTNLLCTPRLWDFLIYLMQYAVILDCVSVYNVWPLLPVLFGNNFSFHEIYWMEIMVLSIMSLSFLYFLIRMSSKSKVMEE